MTARVCEVCQTPLGVVVGRQRKRFCSPACRSNQGVVRSMLCSRCGWQRPKAMFLLAWDGETRLSECRLCRRRSSTEDRAAAPESPLAWDGVTRLSEVRVLRPYQVVCLQAGHVMKADVWLTEFQAARIVILGFKTRCGDCGGWLMLESIEDGRIGGGVQTHAVHDRGHWWPESAA